VPLFDDVFLETLNKLDDLALFGCGYREFRQGRGRMTAAPTFKLLATISIAESKSNPRAHFDPVKLQELADSIKLNGVLEPILVREKGDSFELVCGHRRLRAAKLAGAKMIPAIIHKAEAASTIEQLRSCLLDVLLILAQQNAEINDLRIRKPAIAGALSTFQKNHKDRTARR
jgi:hypothetical protein